MTFIADTSEFPLLKIFQEGRRSVTDGKDMESSLAWALDQRVPFAVAYDASEAGAPGKGANEALNRLLTERAGEFKERCVGIGYCFSEGKLLDAIRSRRETEENIMPFEWEVHTDWDAAVAWSRGRLSGVTEEAR